MSGVGFLSPWLLLGLLAAAIPVVLHLASSSRAKEVYFPTLRLVRMSMERTAHRRRFKHWILLILRCAALGCLAIGLAQPISRALGNFNKNPYAAVIILDDSFSMNTRRSVQTRFEFAAAQALNIIDGDRPPSLVSLMGGTNPAQSPGLGSDMSQIRLAIKACSPKPLGTNLGDCISRAAEILNSQDSYQNRRIYVLTDLQKVSLNENLAHPPRSKQSGDIDVIIVNTAAEFRNVSVSDVQIKGNMIINSPLSISCELLNSSTVAMQATAELKFADDKPVLQRVVHLGESGTETARAKIVFNINAPPTPGLHKGQVVVIEDDDLNQDNTANFAVNLAGSIKTLVITSEDNLFGSAQNPAATLLTALMPFSGSDSPWPVVCEVVKIADFSRRDLENVQAVYLADAAKFSQAQADILRQFANDGGSVMIFLGPNTNIDNYNSVLTSDFLGAVITSPRGIVGPDAPARAVTQAAVNHPYLAGLYEDHEQYYAPLVQRYFRLERTATSTVLMGLDNSDPLVLTHDVSSGKVTLCATTVSSQWSNLAGSAARIAIPMILRCAMLAGREATQSQISLGNPPQSQLDLQSISVEDTKKIFAKSGWDKTYIADDLENTVAQAQDASQPRNYWDTALLIVLLLLILETLIANFHSLRSSSQPA